MPQTNVEIYTQVLSAFNEEGVDGVLPHFDPGVRVFDPDLPGDGTFHGHEGVRFVSEQLMSGFERVQIEGFELIPVDDKVVALLHTSARAAGADLEIEMRDAHTVTFRDGKIVHWRLYTDRNDALADAGLDRSTGP